MAEVGFEGDVHGVAVLGQEFALDPAVVGAQPHQLQRLLADEHERLVGNWGQLTGFH